MAPNWHLTVIDITASIVSDTIRDTHLGTQVSHCDSLGQSAGMPPLNSMLYT